LPQEKSQRKTSHRKDQREKTAEKIRKKTGRLAGRHRSVRFLAVSELGKPVLVEKPLALSLNDAEAILKTLDLLTCYVDLMCSVRIESCRRWTRRCRGAGGDRPRPAIIAAFDGPECSVHSGINDPLTIFAQFVNQSESSRTGEASCQASSANASR
jgi:hypothetical protein